MSSYKELVDNIIKPYSAILFLDNKIAGVLIVLVTFFNSSVAISGVVAIVATFVFAKAIGFKGEYFSEGFYIYNSLLVGMGIGFLFTPSLTSMVLIVISAIFTFALSFMLNRLFSNYKIPILSLPFSMVTMFIYLASLKYSSLYSSLINNTTLYDIHFNSSLYYFFKSLGTIFFLPNAIVGILLFLIVIYFSRILAIMMLIGFYFGVLIHSFLVGSFIQALTNPYTFNYIIVATALCGIFLLPTLRNLFIALVGVAISVVLVDAISILFNYYSIPVFTLPFNITVITFIFLLSMLYYKEFNYNIKSTPEESLSSYLSSIFRFGINMIKISLPFSGEWSVYQAFDGEWTHKGKYKYAYDFIKIKNGKSYKNDGLMLSDYYAFGESILSPVSGYIVDARDDLVDNIIGEVDRVNNWGNYIIIKSDFGFFVEISHIMQNSLMVKIGDYIKLNQVIAKCGNSGYSPEPHIHIQVQELGLINAFTKEFLFSEYYIEDRLFFNSLPQTGEVIKSIIINKSIYSRLIFILDDEFIFDLYKDDKISGEYSFCVKMDSKGEFYFEDMDKNRLYFYTDITMFYFYNYIGEDSYLKKLFILMPRLPFMYNKNIKFVDFIPVDLVNNKIKTMVIELLSIVNKNYYKVAKEFIFDGNKIVSKEGSVELSRDKKGFDKIEYQNIKLIRR